MNPEGAGVCTGMKPDGIGVAAGGGAPNPDGSDGWLASGTNPEGAGRGMKPEDELGML